MKRTFERATFLSDIITTAVEGGVNYWAQVTKYHWSDEKPETTTATLAEHEAASRDEMIKHGKLTPDTVANAIGRIVRNEVKVHFSYIKLIAGATATNDGGDIDAEAADIIAQVAILGEVIYG